MLATTELDLERMRRHARIDALADDLILGILAQAKAARAAINRRSAQRLRRIEERMQGGRHGDA